MRDEFKERLGEIGRDGKKRGTASPGSRAVRSRGAPWGALERGRKALERLEDMPGAVRTDGVFVVERSLKELTSARELKSLLSRLKRATGTAGGGGDLSDELLALIESPDRALFFDTETTGLGGNMVFMLGVMRVGAGDVRLIQVFARDYREERELLAVWSGMLEATGMLVSFNGKSFDAPVLRDRLALHGMPSPDEPPHLDLLHHARRRWKGVFPDCRLQTLEWQVCGRRRSGDIPGEEIPGVYHHFVRTGETGDMLTVFHHNALDLITLADIALALAGPA